MEKIKNYTNTYLRNLLLGTQSYINDKVVLEYVFDDHVKIHKIPAFISLTGDVKFLMDAFVDDIPDKRVELNTDVKQKIVITPGAWRVKATEFANPNVGIPNLEESDSELRKMFTELKSVPIVWNMEFEIYGSSSNEIFAIWEKTMEVFWLYKYFNIDHKRLMIRSYLQIPDDAESKIPREIAFKDDTSLSIKFSVDVHSFFPIFNKEQSVLYNKKVNWNVFVANNNDPDVLDTASLIDSNNTPNVFVPVIVSNTTPTVLATKNSGESYTVPDTPYIVKDQDLNILATGNLISVQAGQVINVTVAQTGVAVVKINGVTIDTVMSGNTLDIPVKNDLGANVGTLISGEWIVPTVTNNVSLKGNFYFTVDTIGLITIDADTAGTYTAMTSDGSSGSITFSKNGGAYTAFSNPLVLNIGDTLNVKRTVTTGLGYYKITGTY